MRTNLLHFSFVIDEDGSALVPLLFCERFGLCVESVLRSRLPEDLDTCSRGYHCHHDDQGQPVELVVFDAIHLVDVGATNGGGQVTRPDICAAARRLIVILLTKGSYK